jgi:hypothetical protein
MLKWDCPRIEWLIEDQAFLRSHNSAPHPPLSSLSHQQLISLHQSSCVSPVELTEQEGGLARSQIVRPWESLALYKSFNILWIFCFMGQFYESSSRLPYTLAKTIKTLKYHIDSRFTVLHVRKVTIGCFHYLPPPSVCVKITELCKHRFLRKVPFSSTGINQEKD